jgi:hypothetical protein
MTPPQDQIKKEEMEERLQPIKIPKRTLQEQLENPVQIAKVNI